MRRTEFYELKRGDTVFFKEKNEKKEGKILAVNKNRMSAWVSLEEISEGCYRAITLRFDEMQLI